MLFVDLIKAFCHHWQDGHTLLKILEKSINFQGTGKSLKTE